MTFNIKSMQKACFTRYLVTKKYISVYKGKVFIVILAISLYYAFFEIVNYIKYCKENFENIIV